ncbi:hypothetical protein ABK040_002413 [Willaertia magna]
MSKNQSLETFLFGAAIDRLGFKSKKEIFDSSKWNEWKFPENCGIIKKVICGADFVAFLNDLNEIFYFGNLSIPHFEINSLWNKVNLSKNFVNIKNIFANFTNLIIQLQNDELIIFKDSVTQIITEKYTKIGINFIACSPLSNHFIIVDKNEQINYVTFKTNFEEKIVKIVDSNNNDGKTIKLIGCTAEASLLVTTNNKMYTCGSGNSGEFGDFDASTIDNFTYMETPFEKESEIIDVKGGYFHFIVLLKNGTVYAIGFNNFGQANIVTQQNVKKFTQFTHPLFENEFFVKIHCTSRGTVLITKNDKTAYFIGEVVYALNSYEKDNEMDKNIKSYKINGKVTVQKVKLDNLGFNDVVGGGWHYIIYKNYNLNESKCLRYYEKNLLNCVKLIHFKDVSIDFVIMH